MPLSVRPIPYEVPAYSLTGDLLSYRTCGLQYRYQNRGALPPSKPVQLWFGQFIHGVMEEAYRAWRQHNWTFPWSDDQLQPIIELIIRRLDAKGTHFQRFQLLSIAIERAFVAINTWGPSLFPTISEAEVSLRGIREMPPGTATLRQSNYYEVHGIVDVMTSVQLTTISDPNPIVRAVLDSLVTQTYEVIVDYKGMRRPSINDSANTSWQDHEEQVLTYSWLRAQQPGSSQVRSGILLYLNELVPSVEDMDQLYADLTNNPNTTDVMPVGTDLETALDWPRAKRLWTQPMSNWVDAVENWWRTGREATPPMPFPRLPTLPGILSEEYRRQRSFRQIAVAPNEVDSSLQSFDSDISEIEAAVANESMGVRITQAWPARPRPQTCTACDFKTFCPASTYRGAPVAP
jgi:hypothetical protein